MRVLRDPSLKEQTVKYRLMRSTYLMALLAAFVVVAGAGNKMHP